MKKEYKHAEISIIKINGDRLMETLSVPKDDGGGTDEQLSKKYFNYDDSDDRSNDDTNQK
jgi:hypothetical protein